MFNAQSQPKQQPNNSEACSDTILKANAEALKTLNFSRLEALIKCGKNSVIFLLPLGVPYSGSESDLAIYGVSLYALKQIGNEAIPLLIAALESNDETTASKAVDTLGAIDTPEAIAAVTAALQDQRETVRDRANIALSSLKARRTLPASDSEVQHNTAQQSEDVHQSAAIASGENSQDFLSYVSSLNTDPNTNALALASVSSQMIPSIIQSLQAKEARIRGFAVYALAEKGSKAAVAVPDLTALVLREADPNVRSTAVFALRVIGVVNPTVISSLIEALKDPESSVRYEAFFALGQFKSAAAPAVPAIVATIHDENWLESISASEYHWIEVLDGIGSDAVPKLTEMLQQSDLQTRRDASYALRRIAVSDKFDSAAMPILVKALQDPDEGVRINLAMALGKTISPSPYSEDEFRFFQRIDAVGLTRAVQAVLSGGR